MDLLRIVVKKRSESVQNSTEDKDSMKRFATRVAKLRGEGPMATSIEPEVTLEVVSINISDIEIPPTYIRKSVGELTNLIASIKTYGIQQPLKVIKIKGTKKFRLVFGRRRLKAAEMAGLDAVPCIVELMTKEDRLKMLSLAENMHRNELSPIEEGDGFRELQQKAGLELDDMAHCLGISVDIINEFIELLDLPEAVRVEILEHPQKFTMALLKTLLRAFKKSKTTGKQMFKAILDGNIATSKEAEMFMAKS